MFLCLKCNKGHTKCTSNIAHTWVKRWCFIPNQKARNRGKVGKGGGGGRGFAEMVGFFSISWVNQSLPQFHRKISHSQKKNSLLGTFGEPDKASLSSCTSQSLPKFTLNLLGFFFGCKQCATKIRKKNACLKLDTTGAKRSSSWTFQWDHWI